MISVFCHQNGKAEKIMRSEQELANAISAVRRSMNACKRIGDKESVLTTKAVINALRWAKGDPSTFGRYLYQMRQDFTG